MVTISQQPTVTTAMPAVTRASLQLSDGLMLGGDGSGGSNELDLLDLVIFVARGRGKFDLLADLAADQGPAERRIEADSPVAGVRLNLANQLVFDLLIVFVGQGYGRPEHDLVAGQGRRVDDDGAAELVLDVGDGRLDLALPLLGGVIFGILAEVAMGAGILDRLDDLGALDQMNSTFLIE